MATAGGLGLALLSQREAIAAFDWQLDPLVLVLATVGFATTSLVQGVAFYLVLRGLGRRPQLAGCLVVWTRSFLARSAPSGALALVARSGTPWPVWALSGASLVGLALAAPRIGGRRLAHLIETRFKVPPTLLRGRVLVAICLLNAAGWLATGAGAWLLLDALTADAPSFAWTLAVYALGVMVGFVMPAAARGARPAGGRDGVAARAVLRARRRHDPRARHAARSDVRGTHGDRRRRGSGPRGPATETVMPGARYGGGMAPPDVCRSDDRCPRCLTGTLLRVHAHDECTTCRYIQPCCQPDDPLDLAPPR